MKTIATVLSLVLLLAGSDDAFAARTRPAKPAQRVPIGDVARHPLEPLTAGEHTAAFELVRAHFHASSALPHEALLFPLVVLREPAKAFVR
ncbi:MAG TPA: hypothetical protein VF698_08390, partial [Thermoanaerobaculia bacterium]